MTTREKIIGEIRAFNRFYTNIIGVLVNHILNTDYSLTEARILFEIYNNDNCTARTIKNIIKIDEGYLSRIIDKLVKQKLIKKQQSKLDGRVYILILTSFG
ncbi:MAG TPA: helix-turn-helix domain-containing protein, partial [Chitinophagaceae bacterium]|nr:helix-turn-helix domain-containing protein [Chitinophagaceae bacterium]